MSYFFYYYLIARSLVTGSRTSLYFTRFVLQLYRYVPFILNLAELLYKAYRSVAYYFFSTHNIRFLLLVIYHAIDSYQVFLNLRILFDYFAINLNEAPPAIKAVHDMTEPYFDFVSKILPKNALSSMLGFYLISIVSFVIKKVYLTMGKYDKSVGHIIYTYTLLLASAASDEKFIFS